MVRQELAGTKDSLEEIYLLRLAQAAEWMGIIGLPLDDCDRFAFPPDSAQASDCTPYRYIDAALNWVGFYPVTADIPKKRLGCVMRIGGTQAREPGVIPKSECSLCDLC